MRKSPGKTSVLVALALLTGLRPDVAAAGSPNCLEADADCTLARAARQAGIFVGAAVGNGIPAPEAAGLLAHFDAITTENAFKWAELSRAEGVYDFQFADELMRFAGRHHLRLRAHTLFWHRFQTPGFVLDALAEAEEPAARLRELMRSHVETVVGRYRGRIDLYDVVNEPVAIFGPGFDTQASLLSAANFFYRTLGVGYIAEAFRLVHAVDPHARLFLNETVWDPRLGDPKADFFLVLVRELVEQGVPLHGVGLQIHGVLGLRSPVFPSDAESLRAYIEAFGALGLPVEITELDLPLPLLADDPDPLAAQAAVYRRVVQACAEARNCTGVTTWGVYDGRTWLDSFFFTAGLAPTTRSCWIGRCGRSQPTSPCATRCWSAAPRRPTWRACGSGSGRCCAGRASPAHAPSSAVSAREGRGILESADSFRKLGPVGSLPGPQRTAPNRGDC